MRAQEFITETTTAGGTAGTVAAGAATAGLGAGILNSDK